ncbi:unnamed protein product [Vitrella brassicaformis CCMP3155]|uniref:Uncharacterized protein n=2 Tax=Vitrella brassicaformis TaxID=1169539 RepID=A0A0G4GB52_VITBC|nr:unnamed protein product [Vitrella brassicaformis CCMP3155]|eukprot:CEM26376.1 unnamed protein product [Vitrella brassicaformis CCMP3155]
MMLVWTLLLSWLLIIESAPADEPADTQASELAAAIGQGVTSAVDAIAGFALREKSTSAAKPAKRRGRLANEGDHRPARNMTRLMGGMAKLLEEVTGSSSPAQQQQQQLLQQEKEQQQQQLPTVPQSPQSPQSAPADAALLTNPNNSGDMASQVTPPAVPPRRKQESGAKRDRDNSYSARERERHHNKQEEEPYSMTSAGAATAAARSEGEKGPSLEEQLAAVLNRDGGDGSTTKEDNKTAGGGRDDQRRKKQEEDQDSPSPLALSVDQDRPGYEDRAAAWFAGSENEKASSSVGKGKRGDVDRKELFNRFMEVVGQVTNEVSEASGGGAGGGGPQSGGEWLGLVVDSTLDSVAGQLQRPENEGDNDMSFSAPVPPDFDGTAGSVPMPAYPSLPIKAKQSSQLQAADPAPPAAVLPPAALSPATSASASVGAEQLPLHGQSMPESGGDDDDIQDTAMAETMAEREAVSSAPEEATTAAPLDEADEGGTTGDSEEEGDVLLLDEEPGDEPTVPTAVATEDDAFVNEERDAEVLEAAAPRARGERRRERHNQDSEGGGGFAGLIAGGLDLFADLFDLKKDENDTIKENKLTEESEGQQQPQQGQPQTSSSSGSGTSSRASESEEDVPPGAFADLLNRTVDFVRGVIGSGDRDGRMGGNKDKDRSSYTVTFDQPIREGADVSGLKEAIRSGVAETLSIEREHVTVDKVKESDPLSVTFTVSHNAPIQPPAPSTPTNNTEMAVIVVPSASAGDGSEAPGPTQGPARLNSTAISTRLSAGVSEPSSVLRASLSAFLPPSATMTISSSKVASQQPSSSFLPPSHPAQPHRSPDDGKRSRQAVQLSPGQETAASVAIAIGSVIAAVLLMLVLFLLLRRFQRHLWGKYAYESSEWSDQGEGTVPTDDKPLVCSCLFLNKRGGRRVGNDAGQQLDDDMTRPPKTDRHACSRSCTDPPTSPSQQTESTMLPLQASHQQQIVHGRYSASDRQARRAKLINEFRRFSSMSELLSPFDSPTPPHPSSFPLIKRSLSWSEGTTHRELLGRDDDDNDQRERVIPPPPLLLPRRRTIDKDSEKEASRHEGGRGEGGLGDTGSKDSNSKDVSAYLGCVTPASGSARAAGRGGHGHHG